MTSAPDGFDAFMADRYSALARTAFLLTADRGHAEDLTQASLLKTLLAWGRLHDPGSAEAYTRQVMARLAMRWGRRRWKGEVATAAPASPAVGADSFDAVDMSDLVVRCLARLPAEQRAVLVLRYFEQRTEAEIASLLRCSRGTVKSRSARALASLRAAGVLDEFTSDHASAEESRHV